MSHDGEPTTILIVDDEVDMRILVRLGIEMANEGLEVIAEASDGSEAIAMWRELDGPPTPHVVILDNRMPILSGLEVARQILDERPGQLIVLYSAHLDAATRRSAEEIGITACLGKDELDRLPDTVRRIAAA